MSDLICGYTGDREAMLMAYLYEEITPGDRDGFEAHLGTCARCRVELHGLGGVRAQLARWSPPVFTSHPRVAIAPPTPFNARDDAKPSWKWREVPGWAQAAAAVLVLGASAGMANVNVHYDSQSGLNIRTGWSNTSAANVDRSPSAASATDLVSRDELVRLEQQLRGEIQSVQTSAPAPVASPALVRNAGATDADVVRRIKALVDESERRQQRELALRVAELMRDVNSQRQSDLRKIDQNLGLIQDKTGVEVLRNRQMLDFYIQRASQRQ